MKRRADPTFRLLQEVAAARSPYEALGIIAKARSKVIDKLSADERKALFAQLTTTVRDLPIKAVTR